ncbi:MAG: glycosyltransferase family 39 protein [Caldilineaceae bacterium]|nr:glycosyltransferase family 39 protein [Caldilineaceae bacterium]
MNLSRIDLAQSLRRPQFAPLLLPVLATALVAHALIFAPLPLSWRAGAALILTGLLPGLLLVEWLVGSRAEAPLDAWERTLYSVGAGTSILVVGMLLLSYLPGPIVRWQTFALFDTILLVLILGVALRPTSSESATTLDEWPPLWPTVPRGWLLAAIISLLLVAGFLRFYSLDYSEFQGDETRVLLRTAEAIQGLEDTLMIHKKGPAEILLPSSIYSLVDRLNEVSARLPFTLLNMAGLLAIFLLGWRMFGAVAGWSAAMILALDGYFVGFARIVQYQSMVFCLVVLTVLILYRLVRTPRLLPNYLTLAAIFLGTAILSHYEGALAAIPGAFLLFMLWRRGTSLARLGRAMIAPLLIGAAILASFYVPFVLHPSFATTYDYIAGSRIGSTFPYNNLEDFWIRTTLYSTTYYLVLMIGVTVLGLARVYWRNLPRPLAWAAIVLLVGGLVMSFIRPSWLVIGGTDHTWLFFALALAGAWFAPRLTPEERTAWLWFGIAAIFMLFFTLLPNTHVYGFIIGWALAVGMVIGAGYQALARAISLPRARLVGGALAALLILLFGNYAAWYFTLGDLEVLRNWRTLRPPGYWVSYEMPIGRSIFGFPLTNGWKAVGVLYADGVLDAPFEVHGKEPVADWYTRGQVYCPRDHVYYLWHDAVEPGDQSYHRGVRQQIEKDGYQLFGEITVNDQPRLAIYKMSDAPLTPQLFAAEEYAPRFDAELSGPIFEMDGPTAVPQIQKPVDFRFGDPVHGNSIRLIGYTLEGQDNVPGGAVHLTLYWQTDAPVEPAYNVFAQVVDRSDDYKAGQADGEPACNNYATYAWQPGETIADRYYIPLAADARPGTYTLLIGMMGKEGNLEISTADGTLLGGAIGIDEVRIAQP